MIVALFFAWLILVAVTVWLAVCTLIIGWSMILFPGEDSVIVLGAFAFLTVACGWVAYTLCPFTIIWRALL